MEEIDLNLVEISLKRRCSLPYKWLGQKQSNLKDAATNFVYKTRSFSRLIDLTKTLDKETKNYALNRWFNFWSAMAVEQLFASHKKVIQNSNKKHKFIDFTVEGIPFDHKSSVFPTHFRHSYEYTKQNPKELIKWLYDNQSSEGRQHYKNRLFMLFYNHQKLEHWKLKAEIKLIKSEIDNYLISFNPKNLYTFDFGEDQVLSDIIWIER